MIPGDGIGPEIVEQTLRVLEAAQKGAAFSLDLEFHSAGAGEHRRTGRALSEETFEACKRANAVLKGPVGDPAVRAPDGTEAGVLGGILRTGLDAYANVRPIRLYPGVASALSGLAPGAIDYVVMRENTEGLYASRGRGFVSPEATLDFMLMTRRGVERIARKAFELARTRQGAPKDGVRRVTCVDKANVLRGFAYFRQIFLEVAKGYPDIQPECRHADATAASLVQDPGRFDVLVTENFLGDLLSDLGGGTIGGLGMCPSGNLGDERAYFEPVHGSAPDIAGQDRANPIAMVLSAAMMLHWLGEAAAASRIQEAASRALSAGAIRLFPDGTVRDGTVAAGRAISGEL
ncbi:MAG: isocitrate/isopropylmalate dehydrogenase family protein [Candidatus Rokubacteria bacterium]|nr:isocitrate/isopropylmalate dehydrogenase family protein [Candidatus Rokubacteria bacterium]